MTVPLRPAGHDAPRSDTPVPARPRGASRAEQATGRPIPSPGARSATAPTFLPFLVFGAVGCRRGDVGSSGRPRPRALTCDNGKPRNRARATPSATEGRNPQRNTCRNPTMAVGRDRSASASPLRWGPKEGPPVQSIPNRGRKRSSSPPTADPFRRIAQTGENRS